MNNKLIIFFISLSLLISFVFLSYREKQLADVNTKNFWEIYFINPKDNSLDFSIENHSFNNNFHYEITSGNNKIKDGDIIIENGKSTTIKTSNENISGKVIIKVSANNETKEIYKNL